MSRIFVQRHRGKLALGATAVATAIAEEAAKGGLTSEIVRKRSARGPSWSRWSRWRRCLAGSHIARSRPTTSPRCSRPISPAATIRPASARLTTSPRFRRADAAHLRALRHRRSASLEDYHAQAAGRARRALALGDIGTPRGGLAVGPAASGVARASDRGQWKTVAAAKADRKCHLQCRRGRQRHLRRPDDQRSGDLPR